MKKLLTLLLSIAMIMVMMPSMAWAAESTTVKTAEELTNAVNSEDAIVLGADITASITIKNGKNVTLDLGGYTLTNTDKQHTITVENGAELRIVGQGTVDNVSHGKAAVFNNGKAVLDGGTFLRTKENGINAEDNGGNSYYNIANHGEMTIGEGVTVSQSGGFSSMIQNGYFDFSKDYKSGTNAEKPALTINGGNFSGGLNTLKNDDNGEIQINGGTFSNVHQYALMNWNKAIITGGKFESDNTAVRNCGNSGNSIDLGMLNISGGEFTGTIDAVGKDTNADNPVITGGTFSTDPSDYVAEDYKIKEGTSYEVVPKEYGIKLDKSTLTLTEYDTATLVPYVVDSILGDVTWSSGNDAVVTVDSNGVVKAVGAGTAVITAKMGDYTATCTVTVKAYVPSVTPPASNDPVTNTGTSDTNNATTNADISKDATSKTETTTETKPDGTTSTTTTVEVSDKTAAAIVDKAVEHQSAEVVVDTTTSAAAAAPAEGDKTEVKLPADTIQTLAEKTTADVTIKSDVAEVTMDAKAVEAVAEQIAETKAETVTLVVENTKNEAEEMHFELNLVTESGKVHEFNGGNVSVTVKLNKTLQAAEKLVCVYIDDNGVMSKVEGYKNADGTFTFITGHFSTYAIMAEDEADKLIEEQTNARLKAGVENTTIKLKSALDGKGIKLSWTKSKGYKVDYYEVYKSTKKANGYGTTPYYKTKDASKTWYKNTKELKKGARYYYKVRGVREIGGKTVYTKYSTKAWRLVK